MCLKVLSHTYTQRQQGLSAACHRDQGLLVVFTRRSTERLRTWSLLHQITTRLWALSSSLTFHDISIYMTTSLFSGLLTISVIKLGRWSCLYTCLSLGVYICCTSAFTYTVMCADYLPDCLLLWGIWVNTFWKAIIHTLKVQGQLESSIMNKMNSEFLRITTQKIQFSFYLFNKDGANKSYQTISNVDNYILIFSTMIRSIKTIKVGNKVTMVSN